MPRCKSCGAEIIWTVTESGKTMPVDAKHTEGGNLMLSAVPPDGPLTAKPWQRSLFDDDQPLRYISHFATCPEAASWRRTG